MHEQSSFSNISVTSPTSQLILQPFRPFTYVTAHSPILPLLHLRHSSFSNLTFASHTSQALHLRRLASHPWCKKRMRYERPSKWHLWAELILQPFRHFTCITDHSPTLSSLYLRHSSFSNLSVTSPTSQLNSNPSVALPMSQLILQPFRCFTYITAHPPTLLSLVLRHRLFTYVTWRAAHDAHMLFENFCICFLFPLIKFQETFRLFYKQEIALVL